jgi:hypothetical protein
LTGFRPKLSPVTEEDKAWYHCGRCGSLFRSPPGNPNERICALCGRDPSLGLETAATRDEPEVPARASREPAPQPDRTADRSGTRKPKSNRIVAKLVIGWVVIMVLVVIGVRVFSPETTKSGSSDSGLETGVKGTSGDETVVNLEKAMPFCRKALFDFLGASTSEERNQVVLDPVKTVGRMARFYDLNPMTRVESDTLKPTATTLLKHPDGPAVEGRWEAPDGRVLDCVFVRQNDEWRLDWDHFARYQEYPWAPYLAGEGPDECEFRLLVRRRVARDANESNQLDLVFVPPRFGRPESTTAPSIEVIIERDTANGKRLTAGFNQRESRVARFGSTLPDLDPEGWLRVRVKLRRLPANAEGTLEKRFELITVIACHWLATDDPGVAATTPAP